MHIALCWEITASEQRRKQVNDLLRAELSGYSWARALGNFYVVKVESSEERDDLRRPLSV
jgi:hypothetical protein